VGLSYRVCFETMVHSGNLRNIYPYRNDLNYPLPAFLASKTLYYAYGTQNIPPSSRKKYFGRIEGTEVFCEGLQGHPGPLMCMTLAQWKNGWVAF
jgi:hypothetical protein